MATVRPMNLLRAMDHSWNGQWYNSDQVSPENTFGGLDVEYLAQQFNFPQQRLSPTQNTFAAFQQEFHAAISASEDGSIPVRSLSGHGTGIPVGFNATYPSNPVFPPLGHHQPEFSYHQGSSKEDSRGFSPVNSIPVTPQLSPASIVPSQQFQPLERTLKPTTPRHADSLKRYQIEGPISSADSLPKRRRSHDTMRSRSATTTDDSHMAGLSDDEKLLLELKEEKNMAWKDISKEFEERLQRPYQVPALQMRYKRLKERLRKWTNEDVAALEAAHEFWESSKFEIIANKMLEFGVHDKWPTKMVERKWLQIQMGDEKNPDKSLGTHLQIPFRVPTTEVNTIAELRAHDNTELGTSPTPLKSES